MPNSVAEAYLLILRPSFVPVIGEAVPIPFNEQIEIDEWSWTLENEEFVARRAILDKAKEALENEDDDDDKNTPKDPKEKVDKVKRITQRVSEIHKIRAPGWDQARKDKEIRKLMDQLTHQIESDTKEEAAKAKKKKNNAKDDDGNLTFTFKKNVDAATTQLLNSMKAGDVMPRAILTLFHRSTNAPVTLAIKFEKVRLKHYKVSVDPTETMADLKEEWTATYESVEYTYQNRPAASGVNLVTKGTVRVFKKKGGSLI